MGDHAVECERCNEEGKMDDETDLKQNITGVERQGRRVPGASEVHHFQTALKEGLEAQSIGTLLLIEQYTSLRNEIEKRIEIRQQILALTLLVAGTFLTVGVETSPRPTSHIPFLSIGLKTSKTLSGLCDSFHAPAALKGELCPNADTSERLRRMSGHGFVHSSKILLKSSTS